MDIRLRARLSAYSKVESMPTQNTNIPEPDINVSGAVLGVNDQGQYTFFPSVQPEDVDMLFKDQQPDIVTKEDIDSLFEEKESNNVTKEDIDTLFDDTKQTARRVTNAEIDSLFD